jgi:hypothetical protein
MSQEEKKTCRLKTVPNVARGVCSLKFVFCNLVPAPFKPPAIHDHRKTAVSPNESSIWEVYINEAVVVDNELVKDWTSSLNFLLVFVSLQHN